MYRVVIDVVCVWVKVEEIDTYWDALNGLLLRKYAWERRFCLFFLSIWVCSIGLFFWLGALVNMSAMYRDLVLIPLLLRV